MEVYCLRGSLEQELAFDLRDLLPESCALAAAVNLDEASRYVRDCLVMQEHRGEKSSGIVSAHEGSFHHRKSLGLARNIFRGYDFRNLPGRFAMGHNRYATAGDPNATNNIQPLLFNGKYGPFAIAHNGTLVHAALARENLLADGVLFQSTTDSELFAHQIARSKAQSLEEAVIEAADKMPAAYSFLIMTPDKLIAMKDRFGVRPLSIATIDDGFLVCSEDFSVDQYPEAIHLRDVNPGEMIIFENGEEGFRSVQYSNSEERFCIFEGIYFGHPRSTHHGFTHEDFRQELGRELARENPDLHANCVIPILDSGKHAALGLSSMLSIPYKEYFLRVHNPPNANQRSFTSATPEERERTAYQKLHLRQDKIRERGVVITVDDSIVRATTMTIINKRLRKAGATRIINCISAPPIVDICPYGMDFQDPSQLIAAKLEIDGIRKEIGADELVYLSQDGLRSVVARTYRSGICDGCFTRNYPVPYNSKDFPKSC